MRNRQPLRLNRLILDNLTWFAASLVLGFFVWVLAITQANPIDQRTFLNIPVRMELSEGMTVVEASMRTVRVNVWAPSSVLEALTPDDIVVRADLTGKQPGTPHVIPLETEIARRAVSDTRPTQITVELDEIDRRQKPVRVRVTGEPPADFTREEPTPEFNQVLVSGAKSQVAAVAAVEATVDLSGRRNPFEDEVQLVAVDAEGTPVSNVTVQPQSLLVMIDITSRDDIREFPVRPNFLFETRPEGYVLSSVSYSPETVFVSGSPDRLESLQGTLLTEPVDLTGHTEDFEATVPVELPEEGLIVLEGQMITVTVGITQLTDSVQFDDIPVESIGLEDSSFDVQITPQTVSILITGPQVVVESLTPEDVRVVVDLAGVEPGTYELSPTVSIGQGQVSVDNVTVLPANLSVQIQAPPEATPEVTATPTPF